MFLCHAREARTEEARICLQQQAVEQEQQQKTKEVESKIKYEPYPSLEKWVGIICHIEKTE
jgi:hypothetical protein